MPSMLPLRALRPDPLRIDPAAATCAAHHVVDNALVPSSDVERLLAREPRSAAQLLVGNGAQRATRAALHVAQWRRAGVWRVDDRPALYLWREGGDDARIGIFALRAGDDSAVDRATDVAAAVVPRVVVVDDPRRRIARIVDVELAREPDVAFGSGDGADAMWIVDDEDDVVRLAALLHDGARPEDVGDATSLAFCVLPDRACAPPIGAVVARFGASS